MSIHELRAKRASTVDALKALSEKVSFDKAKDQPEFDRLMAEIGKTDDAIKREKEVQAIAAEKAIPVDGQDAGRHTVFAQAKSDVYTNKEAADARGLQTHKGLTVGGICRMLGAARGSVRDALDISGKLYGDQHPVTKALVAGVGGSGGYIIPPEYINEIIELLRAKAVVRKSNPRTMPMPRGTMTLPAQTAAATATYSGEATKIAVSQQKVGQIIASYKKLTALVPISNDLMRYADPAADAFVRDDLVKVVALREDLAFITGDGTANTPRGFLSFASQFAIESGGSGGTYLTGAASTAASGGNFITSTEAYTLATVAAELGGMVNKLDTANVPDERRTWFMHPRSYNYLFNVQNSLGLYVYREEMMGGTLLTYPIQRTTQMPTNIELPDTTAGGSFVMLVEMTDAMILDSMTLELFVSREGSYVDANGNTQSLVQNDETLVRAIAEHDFQMRHPASVAVDQFVLWAPAIS